MKEQFDEHERFIGQAMMADNLIERNKFLYRSLIKHAVQTAIFCRCGTILDQRKAVLIEVDDSPIAILCEACAKEPTEKWAKEPRVKITRAKELYRKA